MKRERFPGSGCGPACTAANPCAPRRDQLHRRVRFEANRYVGPHEWEWRDRSPDWDGWQAYGNDATGSYAP